MQRGQAWSMDLVIGVLIFLVAIGSIYSLLNSQKGTDSAPLRIESEVIANVITSNASNQMLQVTDANQLDMVRLGKLAQDSKDNYEGLKKQLGIENEFCIYLQDEEGNLIYITDPDAPTVKYAGVGSGSDDLTLTEGKVPCGVPCTIANGKCT